MKACGSAFFVVDAALTVTVTAAAVIVTKLLADNGAPLVSDAADVALVVDEVDIALVAGTGGAIAAGADVVFTDVTSFAVAALASETADLALVAGAGGAAAAGADESQKSLPVPH